MKGKNLLKTRWITCLAIGIVMLCGFFWTSVKGTELEEVDLSKGVTYEKEEEDNIINLNGNSVIITDSENSTDTCNIYLDTNRNGQRDDGQTPISLNGSTDISANIPIFGIYKQKSDTPIVITVSGRFSSDIYGVYEGELNTGDSEETACTINIQKGQLTGCIYAAVNSNIVTATSTAAAITVSDSSVSVVRGVAGGEIITGGSNQKAVDISITGNMIFSDSGSINGILQDAKIQGDVAIDIQPETTSTISSFFGISDRAAVDGSVAVNINHLNAKIVISAVNLGCLVTGDLSLMSGNEVYTSQYFLNNKSQIDGDVTGSLYGNMQEDSSKDDVQCTLVSGGLIGGNVDVTLQDGRFSGVNGIQNATVKGNVDISFEAGTYAGSIWGISGSAAVDGNVTLTSGEKTAINSQFIGCTGGSVIGGSFMADIYSTTSNISVTNTFIGVSDANVAEGIDVKLHGGDWKDVYGINSSSSRQYTGDCRIELENLGNCSKILGIQGASITGKATVIMTECESQGEAIRGIYGGKITGDTSITITDCSAHNRICGISDSTIHGNTDIYIKNAICTSSYSVYGVYSDVNLGGSLTVDVEGTTAYSVYGTHSTTSVNNNCDVTVSIKECKVTNIYGVSDVPNSTPITGITDITIQDCIVTDTVRGIASSTVTKDAIVKTDNNQMKNFIGADTCTIVGNFSVITTGDNSVNASEGYYYGVQNGTMVKDVTITTKDCQYNDYKGVEGANCVENTRITIDGGTYTGSTIQPYSSTPSNKEEREVVIVCKNASFTSKSSYAVISNDLSAGTLTMTIEDSCTVSDAYNLSPLGSNGANALLTYQNDYYFAGSYPITGDINAGNIYFGKLNNSKVLSANILIPEGITVTATEQIYIPNCGEVLIEGTLNGTVNQENNNYQQGTIYMNGGEMEAEEEISNRYYPITISYLEKGGIIAPSDYSSISINDLRPEQYFGLVGGTPAVTCKAKMGYTLTEVTVTKDGSEPQVLTPEDNEYSFTMEACPAELAVTFTGNQITLKIMNDSLTTKLYEETTKDEPLYDMTTIEIFDDGDEGDVTYEVNEEEGMELPQGLVLEDGKLFGVPTQAFEDGAKVVIQVTGRNDTTTEFVLNITVMAGDEDGTPAYRVPEDLTARYGDTLGDVDLPSDENGVFTWNEEESTSVGNAGTREFLATYTPANKKYKVVTDIPVTVTVQKAAVEFSKIEELTAKHGETLADLVLPETPGGEYYWVTAATVEPLDKTAYQLGFRPEDADNYDWEAIDGWDEETASVLMPVMITIQHVYGTEWENDKDNHWHACECGEVQGKAEHTWNAGVVTKEAAETEDGVKQYTCTVCEATKEEVIPATGTTHTHVYSEAWEKDEKNHWHVCECGEIQGKAEHVWDNGVVTKEATATEDGVKQYTCTVCNATRTEALKATGNTGNTSENPPVIDTPQNPTPIDTPQSPQQTGTETNIPAAGTVLTDSVTKAKYRVTSKEGEELAVTYLSSTNASASTLSIAANVTIDGVSYKVTAIADNAFKNNKKLKSITIGSNIVTIGNSAFYGCTALKKVTIPKKVKKIGSKAFYNCKKLVSITIKTTKLTTKSVGSKAFTKAGSSNYKKLTVKVPKKKFKAYKTMLRKKGLSPKAKVKK